MPAFANIAATDYGAHGVTPVTNTFVPSSIDSNGVATYVVAGATSLDDRKLTLSKRIVPDSGRIKMTLKVQVPVTATETINGVSNPKLLRTAFAELTLTADAASTLQEREDIIQLLRTCCESTDQPWAVWTLNGNVY
jgi:hypothetical protein